MSRKSDLNDRFYVIRETMENYLEGYSFVIELPVIWGDMDALQHVNNTVYFRYFESVRMAYFEKLGFWEFMQQTGIGPILASTQCRFKIPLTYPDQVSVGTKIRDLQEDRFVMEYAVFSHRHRKIAAHGDGLIVSYNYRELAKTPLPDELKKRIVEDQGQ
jgi:acyl-CoA thioester hydrolase